MASMTKTGISVISSLGADTYRIEVLTVSKFQIDLSSKVNGVNLLMISNNKEKTYREIVVLKNQPGF